MSPGRRLTGCQLVTTDDVLSEVLAAFCEAGPALRQRAAALVRNLHQKPTVTVYPQSRQTFLSGLSLYETRPDKGYSLTDCISMQTMRQEGISGGQTGADQAAWWAAKAHAITAGGWMPKGFLTEDGPRPEFAELYGAIEMPTDSYRPRTEQNVRDSQATLWFGSTDTPGAKTNLNACQRMGRPHLLSGHSVKSGPLPLPPGSDRSPTLRGST
jgi:Circularly permutated YpsA SLOG family